MNRYAIDQDDDQGQPTDPAASPAGTSILGGGAHNPGADWLVPLVREILKEELRKMFSNTGMAMQLGQGQLPAGMPTPSSEPPAPSVPAPPSPPSTPEAGSNLRNPSMPFSRSDWDEIVRDYAGSESGREVVHQMCLERPEAAPHLVAAVVRHAEVHHHALGDDHFSAMTKDVSEQSDRPPSQVRTITSVPTLSDDSVRGIAGKIIHGGSAELLAAFRDAMAAGCSEVRNFAITIADFVGGTIPANGNAFPDTECVRSICHLIVTGGDVYAPLVGAVRAAVNTGMKGNRDAASVIARSADGPAPTPMTLSHQMRYRVGNEG
jgi:hypothetical protein